MRRTSSSWSPQNWTRVQSALFSTPLSTASPLTWCSFATFQDGERSYIARTWLREPSDAEPPPRKEEAWNGRDFGVEFQDCETRQWEDARAYGFVSAGGGLFFIQTLKNLFPGARVFAHIPSKGYVGVGTVTERAVPVKEFTVIVDGQKRLLLELPHAAPKMDENADDAELAEWFVKVDWIKDVPTSEAFWRKGMFAGRNTASKLRSKFTLDNLVEHFGLDESRLAD